MTLIERLKTAEVGSRELSDEVLRALEKLETFAVPGPTWNGTMLRVDRPDPTCSVDDALRWVVPQLWERSLYISRTGHTQVRLTRPEDIPPYSYAVTSADTTTTALALSIAGLEAQELTKQKEPNQMP